MSDAKGAKEYLHRWDNVTEPSDVWFLPPFDWNATILCDDVVSAEIQPSLRLLVFSGATIITLLESTSIVLAVAIFAILRRDRKAFSKQTYRMNVQMTALLVAQFLAPFLFMMLPLIILLARHASSSDSLPTKSLGDAYIVAFSLYGYANSLLTLFFLAPYRRKMKEHVRWVAAKLGYKSKENAVTVVSQSLSLTETSATRRGSLRRLSLRRATE
ncbi:hypothetical protein AAVH_29217 [Aphelenchoides avenae]|nr:hypothetical protein AAVH_29217 [Aphelenchus avenae]